jgi:hypothetical protein
MPFTWNPNWPTVKNDWVPEDAVTDQDFNDIANAVIAAMNGMDDLVDWVTNEVVLQNLRNIYEAAAGTNTYTSTISGIVSYSIGDMYNLLVTNGNTGAATLNINSLGAVAIRKEDAVALNAGDIVDNSVMQVVYDGTYFRLLNPSSTSKINDLADIISLGGII